VIDAWLVIDHSAPDSRHLIVARPHTARREANHRIAGHRVAVHIGLRAALADLTARLEGAAMAGERVEAQVERG
jgi:hypothetical protein